MDVRQIDESAAGATATPLSANAAAAALEEALGSPFDPLSPVSFQAAMEADEAEVPPERALAKIRELGASEQLVPRAEGGQLGSFEQLLAVNRIMSRRDLVLPVGMGSSFLATMPVWLWGDDRQRQRVAELILAGEYGAAGVSENQAGSDVLKTQMRAEQVGDGYVIDGEKWPIGNGRRAAFVVVLADASPSFGLFLVDREQVPDGSLRRLPKVRTLGLRAHDLSGVTLERCAVPADAVIGRVGRGIEMLAGSLQFTRTLISGLALGGADTALRIAVRWARERVLYGQPILALPPVRHQLVGAFCDVLTGECVATTGARGLNLALRRMSLWSSVTKYVVPMLCEQSVRECAEVMSARYYLREGVAFGVFQKFARDITITSIFEGTQSVQLETVMTQLAHAARRRSAARPDGPDLSELFRLGAPVPDWDPRAARPALAFGQADEVVDSLDRSLEQLDSGGDDVRELRDLARRFVTLRDETRSAIATVAEAQQQRSDAGYELARRHCFIHAAACCLAVWLENRERVEADAADAAWPTLCLARLLARLPEGAEISTTELEERCLRWLVRLETENRLFSLVPFPLAGGETTGNGQ